MSGFGVGCGIGIGSESVLSLFPLHARLWRADGVFDKTAAASAVFDKTQVFIIATEPEE